MAAKKLTEYADEVGGAVVDAVEVVARRDPLLTLVIAFGALAIVGGLVWNVRETNQTVSDAIHQMPSKKDMAAAIKAHSDYPHPGVVSREEFKQVLGRLDTLSSDVRNLGQRIDRLLERDK